MFKIDGMTFEIEPSITKCGFEGLEDNPETHRWLAVLEHHYPDVPLHGDFTTIEAEEF